MNRFRRRSLIGVAGVVLAGMVLVAVDLAGRDRLYSTNFLSGWVLFGVILGLAALNLRKKLPVLPLGKVTAWVQVHIYVGWFAVVTYWIHAHSLLPGGRLEAALALFFVIVAGSGAVGLALSRLLPRRLTRRGENLLFDRIPGFRSRLREQVEELVLKAGSEYGSVAIPEFYTRWLQPFFARPRNFWGHVVESRRGIHALSARMASLERYLDQDERRLLEQIAERVRTKDDLDYQYALQALLKGWLFVHIPLTFGLIGLAVSHAVLVYAFGGAG